MTTVTNPPLIASRRDSVDGGGVTIDDLLGPSTQRYFGHGYRRVGREVNAVEITPGYGQVHAESTLNYPADWSAKSGTGELRPHLSSVDALLIAVELVEAYLVHAHRLSAEQRRTMWVRRMEMRAGAKPQESLRGFTVHAARTGSTGSSAGRSVSSFVCKVGTIKVWCEIDHETGRNRTDRDVYATVADLLGPGDSRYYGSGYQARGLHIGTVAVDAAGGRAEAFFQLSPVDRDLSEGLGAAYQPAASPLDILVGVAQLSQVLLYRLDRVDRESTNTLWMRRIVIDCAGPDEAPPAGFLGSATILKTSLLTLAGTVWRNAELAGEFGHLSGTCTIAHQLPAGVVAPSSR